MALVPFDAAGFQPPQRTQAEYADGDEGQPLEESLEGHFGQIMSMVMQDEASVSEAVHEFQLSCLQQARDMRHQASQVFHNSAQCIRLRKLADEVEAQAASWQLLQQLYCIGDNPAGTGGPQVSDVGGERTYRQLQRDAIMQDPVLQRVAQVLSWLESLAAQRLERQDEPRFTPKEGVWSHTRATAQKRPGTAALELDMDAPTRGAVVLAREDQQNEERVCQALWQLVRAGKIPEARQLCRHVGQSWRAADLAGAGPYGPLPVGHAAAEQDHQLSDEAVAAELAAQVEGGRGAGTRLWKWACYSASEAAATAPHANRHEAALYGAMCGHVGRMLPVCGGWEDECWAYCRAWLDLAADEAVAGDEVEQGESVGADVLAAAVAKLASGYSVAAEPNKAVQGMQVAHGKWPLPELKRDPERTLVPSSFEELASLLQASTNPATRKYITSKQRVLQTQMITSRFDSLVVDTANWVLQVPLSDGQGPAAGAQWQGRQGQQQEEAGEGALLLRFAAHMGLVLRALGLVPDDRSMEGQVEDTDELDALSKLKQAVDKVIGRYTLSLIRSPTTRHLASSYLCHLAIDIRGALFGTLVTAASADTSDAGDAECKGLYGTLAAAFDQWHGRQQALEEGQWQVEEAGQGVPSNFLFGDVRAEELRLLLDRHISQARASPSQSPMQRTRLLRWLFYPFLIAQQQAEEQDDGVPWQGAFDDALRHTVGIATEFALGPGPISATLEVLLQKTMPAEFERYVAAVLAASAAAGVSDVEEERQLGQLQRQLGALQYWQRYSELSVRYHEWTNAAAAAKANSGSSVPSGLMAAGQQLASSLLAVATSDGLAEICDPMQDLEEPTVLKLLVTGDATWDGGAAGAAVGEYPRLSRGALGVLRGQVAAALESATAGMEDVWFEVEVQEPAAAMAVQEASTSGLMAGPPAAGGSGSGAGASEAGELLLVRLHSWSGDTPEGMPQEEASHRVQQRMRRSWAGMARIAAALLAKGGRRFGGGAPRLCLVGMEGSVATMAQVARHRNAAKLLLRTAKVVLQLAALGTTPATNAILDELLLVAAGGAGSAAPQLLGLLRDWDVKKLLQIVELAMEEIGGGLWDDVNGAQQIAA